MATDGCAFVCSILCAACAILSGYVLATSDWEVMILVTVFAVIVVLLAAYALFVRYCR